MSVNYEETQEVDVKELVPYLKRMERVTDADVMRIQAETFLDKCRFGKDKIAKAKHDLQSMTSTQKILQFCWNVVLSGQGQAVLKW